jgi:hypothetical protein
MDVILYPGRGVPLKRYESFLSRYLNLHLAGTCEHPIAIICHSRGIDLAIEDTHKDIPIIALDPSSFPLNDERVHIWARKGRHDIPERDVFNLHIYDEQTHYPHEIKRIRDQVVMCIRRFDISN